MSHKIKFRAWNGHAKQIQGIEFINVHKVFEMEYPKDTDLCLMQYTGLNDKNGVEVYEGDIIENRLGVVKQVRFLQSQYGWYVAELDDINCCTSFSNFLYNPIKSDCTVLGNIYENPNLLEGISNHA